MNNCCKDKTNLKKSLLKDYFVCKVCKRKHYVMEAQIGNLGIKLSEPNK